jgi:O-antigen/teichoic acid export membrane protein
MKQVRNLELMAISETPINVTSSDVSRSVVIRGALWSSTQTVANKAFSLLAMLFLAYLLPPEQYGLASVAVSIGATLIIAPPFAMTDVLLARSGEFGSLRIAATRLALISGIAIGLVIMIAAAICWVIFARADIACLLACVALRPVGDALMIVPMSQLRIQLRFRELSIVDTGCNLASTLLGIGLAWIGGGAIAIVFPPIAAVFMRWIAYRTLTVTLDQTPSGAFNSSTPVARSAFGVRRQFAVASLGQYITNLVAVMEPLALTAFASTISQGYFSLASQIASQTNYLLASQLGMVLQPALARLNPDPARQAGALNRAVHGIALISIPASIMQVALAPSGFHVFLGEKWNFAIAPFMALSFAQIGAFLAVPALALLKAQGRFWTNLLWQAGHAIAAFALFSMTLRVDGLALCEIFNNLGVPCSHDNSECLVVACGSAVIWSISAPIGMSLALEGQVGEVLKLLRALLGVVVASSGVGFFVYSAVAAIDPMNRFPSWAQATLVIFAGATGLAASIVLSASVSRQGREYMRYARAFAVRRWRQVGLVTPPL